MRVVDYFAGAGGFTLGAQLAGCTVVAAVNHWRLAVDTHARIMRLLDETAVMVARGGDRG